MDPHVDNANRIAGATRHGVVEQIDHSGNRVRIRTGQLLTDWLPMSHGRAGTTRDWDPLTIGEQVTLQCPSGDLSQARLLPSLNSDNAPPPDGAHGGNIIREFPDGARLVADHAASVYVLSVPPGGKIALRIGDTQLLLMADHAWLDSAMIDLNLDDGRQSRLDEVDAIIRGQESSHAG